MTRPWSDADRTVEFEDETLLDPAGDEPGPSVARDERLIEDRPPHWEA